MLLSQVTLKRYTEKHDNLFKCYIVGDNAISPLLPRLPSILPPPPPPPCPPPAPPQDPGEHNDPALSMPDKARDVVGKLREAEKKWFNPDRGDPDPRACEIARRTGFWQPFLP